MDAGEQEYDEQFVTLLQAVWGEGYLSPGGDAEVDRLLQGTEIAGARVLDIGCGVGGPGLHLLQRHGARQLTGVDVEALLVAQCQALARRRGLHDRSDFVRVTPGALPFPDASFELVFSKDSIIHIADKQALAGEIQRLLVAGGRFVASDWLAGYEGAPSAAMQRYLDAEGLDFGLASATQYRDALAQAGLREVAVVDRNAWYRDEARTERAALAGELRAALTARLGEDYVEAQIATWDAMIEVLDRGELRPSHLYARAAG